MLFEKRGKVMELKTQSSICGNFEEFYSRLLIFPSFLCVAMNLTGNPVNFKTFRAIHVRTDNCCFHP